MNKDKTIEKGAGFTPGEWEYQDVIAGKGRIQVRVEG